MSSAKFLVVLFVLFSLVGAGCLGKKSDGAADGGTFKTNDSGDTWAQQTAIPSARGVGTIASTDVIALEIDPRDALAVYAGTRAHGLLYSLDGTTSWQQPRDPALKEGTISDMEVDPTDACTVYVARGARLYKTEDCLRTFDSEAYVETRANVGIVEIAVDWYNPGTVWIGLSNGDVLKSEDGAASWHTSLAMRSAVTGMLVGNADSRAVLVGTETEGLYRTADGGATWVQVKDGLKEWKNAAKVTSLTQDQAGVTTYASTAYGILRSTDFGATWSPLQLLTSPGQVSIQALAIDPLDAARIYYAAGKTFYRSIDGGLTWDTAELPTTRAPMAIAIDPTNASILHLGVATVEK